MIQFISTISLWIERQSNQLLDRQVQIHLLVLVVVALVWNFLFFLSMPIAAVYQNANSNISNPSKLIESIELTHSTTESNAFDRLDYVVLKQGENIFDLADHLVEKNYLTNQFFFIFYGYLSGDYRHLQAGQYALKNYPNIFSLVEAIKNGQVITHYFAIIAGEDFSQVLANQTKTNLIYDSSTENWLNSLSANRGEEKTNYNQFLIADSFAFRYQDNFSVVLKASHQKLKQTLDDLRTQTNSQWVKEKTNDEMIVIASLIEKESADFNDRKKIAGVIKNRLEKSMKLQIDASAIFAHKIEGREIFKPTREDLTIQSQYNTYQNFGLPQSAIAIVSQGSLEAAFNPEEHSYLFYVARKDQPGVHYFSETYEQHLKFISQNRNQSTSSN